MKLRAIPVVLTVLALTLTGCTASGGTVSAEDAKKAGCTVIPSGSESDSVKVTGEFGKKQTTDFKKPFTATKMQRTIIDKGDGDLIAKDDSITALVTLYNAETGDELASENTEFPVNEETLGTPGLFAALACVPMGTRSVTIMTAADFAGPDAQGTDGQSVILVVDAIKKAPAAPAPDVLKKADIADNFPTVEMVDGKPVMTLPNGKPSEELQIRTDLKGDGEVVQEKDKVTVNYLGAIWDTGVVFDQSYTRGEPTSFATNEVVPGFGQALVGQTVGSRVIVAIPPALGYREGGNAGAGIKGTDTIVFVIEILSTERAAAPQ